MGGREGVGGSRRRATPLRWEESYAYVTRDVEERERNKQQSTSNDDECWKGKGKSGGFGGGRTSLDSDPTRQADFFLPISARHFAINSVIAARLSSGILSFGT